MFRIEMLPAAHGDCLWIEYGTGAQAYRILIDGGPALAYPVLRDRLLQLPSGDRKFELLVVTHIDADHIEGIIRLLQDVDALGCSFKRIWFNGREQLDQVPDPAGKPLGALQGETLGLLIADYETKTGGHVWNVDFPSRLAAIDRTSSELPAVTLEGDCRLTLLSPDYDRLLDLKDRWSQELRKAGINSGDELALRQKLDENPRLQPLGDVLGGEDVSSEWYEFPDPEGRDLKVGLEDKLGGEEGEADESAPFGCDSSKANGSCIALLLTYPARDPAVQLMLCGDAWPSVLEASLNSLLSSTEKKLTLTGLKISHHGSVANITPSLLSRLRCKHYLISTSGAVYRHPHVRAVELLINSHQGRGKPQLHFNYRSETTLRWADPADQKHRGYRSFHPKGLSLIL